MTRILIVSGIFLFTGFSTAFSAPKAVPVEVDRSMKTSLDRMTKITNRGAFLKILGTGLLIEDIRFMMGQYKKTKLNYLENYQIRKISDKSITVPTLVGPLVFEKEGVEVYYRETKIVLDPGASFEENYQKVKKKLAKWHARTWWMDAAHAQSDEAEETEALHLVTTMEFIFQRSKGKLDKVDAMIAGEEFQQAFVDTLGLEFQDYAQINSFECHSDSNDNVGSMSFRLASGKTLLLEATRNAKGKITKVESTLGGGEKKDVTKLYGAMYGRLSKRPGGICGLTIGDDGQRAQFLKALRQVQTDNFGGVQMGPNGEVETGDVLTPAPIPVQKDGWN